MGAFEKAAAASNETVPDFFVNLALAARSAGEPDRATAVLDRILARAPDASPAHLLKAEAFIDKGDLERAETAADRALSLMPNDAVAHAAAGRIALIARRPSLAVERLNAARALAPSDGDILVSLGHARALAEEVPAAAEAYRASELAERERATLSRLREGVRRMERVESRFETLVGPYPDALPRAGRDARERLRRVCRDDVAALGITEPTVLDKQPLNMNRVGLMRLLFPEAPVVFVDRHPSSPLGCGPESPDARLPPQSSHGAVYRCRGNGARVSREPSSIRGPDRKGRRAPHSRPP